MIKYSLICADAHEFEAWFRNSEAFEAQADQGHVTCPTCGSTDVQKAIMAPSISTSKSGAPGKLGSAARELMEEIRKVRNEIIGKSEYVGAAFADEARKIHNEEADDRAIYGEASVEDATSLLEDGIAVLPIPRLPEDAN